VWEWCRNLYDDTAETAVDQSGEYRALRGGSWGSPRDDVRAACRLGLNPSGRNGLDLGFRLVVRCSPSQEH